jgi:hypothetical protein
LTTRTSLQTFRPNDYVKLVKACSGHQADTIGQFKKWINNPSAEGRGDASVVIGEEKVLCHSYGLVKLTPGAQLFDET